MGKDMTIVRTTALKAAAVLTAMALTTWPRVATVPAQVPDNPAPSSTKLAGVPLTPEDVLSIRDIRGLQLSPDGKKVAFEVREPTNPKLPQTPRATNIWIVPTDGSAAPHVLISHLTNATSPRWSPDGRWLAFRSDRGEPGVDDPKATIQVYLLRTDGDKAEQLTSVPSGVPCERMPVRNGPSAAATLASGGCWVSYWYCPWLSHSIPQK